MSETAYPKILYVVNPFSGNTGNGNVSNLIKAKGDALSATYRIYQITGINDMDHIRKQIQEFSPDIVASAGGDGTCNMVAQLLINTRIALGIIPTGSANGMATELNIPKNIDAAIDLLYEGTNKKIDLLWVNESDIALHLSDVGLNARIIKRFTKENKRGFWRYVLHFFSEYFLTRYYRFIIQCDDRIFKRRAISITFANASKYGSGAMINPKGIIDDGFFELCIVKPFPWYYLVPIIIKFFRGNLDDSKYVEITSCKEASISCRKKLVLHVDGEIKRKTYSVSVKILPLALDVIVP